MRPHQLLTALAPALLLLTATPALANPQPAIRHVVAPVVVVVPTPVPPPIAPARLTINAPADAVLIFNGVPVAGSGDIRAFETAPLYAGYPYAYEVTAVVFRGRQMVQATERVVVWAGEVSKVTFLLPPPPAPLSKPKPVGGGN